MIYVAGSIVALAALVGVLLTAITLPGIWFMILVALAIDVLWRPDLLSWWTIGIAIGLALLSELVELVASAAGSKRAGGTRAGAWGSIGGSLIGLVLGSIFIPIPIVGSLIGAVVGAGVGAVIAERGFSERTWTESAKSGGGAAAGRLLSAIIKTAFAVVIAFMLVVDAFWN